MRRPTLADRYGLQPGPGVTEVVEGRASLEDALQPLTNVRGDRHGRQLDVLVAGQLPPDPWAVLQSEAMGWILQTLKRDHDLVVVDTPRCRTWPTRSRCWARSTAWSSPPRRTPPVATTPGASASSSRAWTPGCWAWS